MSTTPDIFEDGCEFQPEDPGTCACGAPIEVSEYLYLGTYPCRAVGCTSSGLRIHDLPPPSDDE